MMKFEVMKFLKEEVVPARGWTEPIAVSLSVSLAYFLDKTQTRSLPTPDDKTLYKDSELVEKF